MDITPQNETSPAPTAIEGSPLPGHLQKLVDLLPFNTPIHRSTIEEKYGRSNYARRIRKIVAEYGWDIERYRGSDGANDDWYVRKSEGPVRRAFIRREVAPKVRNIVYLRDNWRCALCCADVSREQVNTQAQCDHKVPAERGGPSDLQNLQTLCLQCNLKKRQACRHCILPSCKLCPYAFPEQFETVLVLRLDQSNSAKLDHLARSSGVPQATIITQLIDQA